MAATGVMCLGSCTPSSNAAAAAALLAVRCSCPGWPGRPPRAAAAALCEGRLRISLKSLRPS